MLAACNSGRGSVAAGEGVVGLARALMACGVPTVVVALWPVPDRQTGQLMRGLYERLATGETVDVAAALREANPAAAHDPRSVSRALRQALAWLLKAYPIANLGLR